VLWSALDGGINGTLKSLPAFSFLILVWLRHAAAAPIQDKARY
jgi:hypothetical protein